MGRNRLETLLQYKEIIMALSLFASWGVALWLTVKSIPFSQADINFEYRVSALEASQSDFGTDIEEIKNNIGGIRQDVGFIKGQLTKIK